MDLPPPATAATALAALTLPARALDAALAAGAFFVPGITLDTMAPGSVRREIVKQLPSGELLELLVDVSDRRDLDSSFLADGWDVIPLGGLSIRLRLRA